MHSLDLYAKIEPLIGFYDEYDALYSSYLQLLYPLHVNTILDIGCGNGRLLKLLQDNDFKAFGIDRSKEMITRAQSLGVNADTKELKEFKKGSFECALAVGDVLNYMKEDELNSFFSDVSNTLSDEGYFLFDVNTLAGFEVADGAVVKDEEDKFLSIEANFEENILTTNITLFEKEGKTFNKISGEVKQYYHTKEVFQNLKEFRYVADSPISMFSDEEEKLLILLQKR
ncbi:class I SAM-dependent DNA methyltransferase [Sulfurospirillum arcachonense]|uniref:class I SAM-dependent DNA methyltransferase n=1 Tax=Sulfurospirillum arcachonense TaxID=57666 RepID=UPI0004684FB3|nr:class I SAM-dependent methyltransferase [Sulfurospirillum arcachonense]